ncbi:hypothetical protein JRO89_XS15G0076500 [Xanthoceras sorbifolium]|uniref:non-specific serine/threonine protein kinase n=1 Tax=Xanthoceras sorbifolium TaxID=99658 RepID=A0ABQ8H197_9ROSI|nr:hypothetical protein JRO89_XS15G0076500 [Xanthoceras sorbifolium]
MTINGNTIFEDDTDRAGPSRYVSRSNWAFSSTGHFLDDDRSPDTYIWTNSSILLMNDTQLYMQARLSPISLTYYGFCMGNGNYTVNLHFAEIMFTDDKTYNSFGRHVFDVYIQGKLVLKDFNIEDEAGGAGKATIKPFIVAVTNKTLEIRLYWAGKGTTGIPVRGVYGPLISAVSVTPNFIPPSEKKSSSTTISVGTVLGIVAAAAFLIILVLGILWWKCCLRHKNTMYLGIITMECLTFLLQLSGLLADGSVIAVKQLSSKSKQGNREFVNEIGMISALQHPHLVKLYGCCIEGNQLLLVYEYLENNSLARALFGPEEHQLKLDWPTRHKICVEKRNLMELVDAKLGSELNEEQVMVMINVALLCSDVSPSVRPSMSTVVSLLEGRAAIQDFVPDSIVSLADDKTKSDSEAMRKYY